MFLIVTPAHAVSGVVAESVSDYSFVAGDHSADTNCGNVANDFYTSVTASGTIWTPIHNYHDSLVWDTDFYDPEANTSYDYDTTNFDPSAAISFFCGHGTCDDVTNTGCTANWQCSSGACSNNPPSSASSACVLHSGRRIVTSSSTFQHGNTVFYGNGGVKWGEGTTGGGWAGGGTNGGANVVILINSCGLRYPFYSDLIPAFAGVHSILGLMPVSDLVGSGGAKFADAHQSSTRGSLLATYMKANSLHAISNAWFANLDSIPQTSGGACPNLNSTYTYGGGHGFSGCGANYVMSVDSSYSRAAWHASTESWLGAQSESNDSAGNGYLQLEAHCNYDCNMYPFTK